MKNTAFLLVPILIALAFSGCGGASSDEYDSGIHTVVLVSIDTWRRDYSGFSGNMNPSPTPFLDSLAARGMIFDQALTPVPYTAPAHWSMLSGRWPWRDGVMMNGDLPAEDHPVTLPEILRKEGFITAAFVSCRVLDHRVGFAEGFDHFDDVIARFGAMDVARMSERSGDRTVNAFRLWFGKNMKRGEKLFLWIHLFDPHAPYIPRKPGVVSEPEKYASEVEFADSQVRRVYETLLESGRNMDRSLWLVMSDHGEGLGEHGEDTHGILLHGATVNIPFFISGSGIDSQRKAGLVSTVDVFPTVLGKLDISSANRDGINILKDHIPGERSIPLESVMGARGYGLSPATGIRKMNWLWERSPRDHLWDLETDPEEKKDIALQKGALVRKLAAERKSFGSGAGSPGAKRNQKMDLALRSLGYITGSQRGGRESVREYIRIGGRWLTEASRYVSLNDYKSAESLYIRFLEKYSGSPGVWNSAGMVSVNLKDFKEAEKRFRKSLSLEDGIQANTNLGNVLFFTGKLKEAEQYYLKALKLDDEDLYALFNIGLIREKLEGLEEAVPFYKKFISLYPSHRNARAIMNKLKAAGLL